MFHYNNTETKHHRGKRTVRKVHIRGKTGYKSITKYVGGKRRGSVRHKLQSHEIDKIKEGKFIPGLFRDCKVCSRVMNSTRKNR